MTPEAVFEFNRPTLLALSYRMLGSMWDAEDVVQEAFLRWSAEDRSGVGNPAAFLMTVVTRLCLDQLRSARVRREVYPGPWLPEPVSTTELGLLETAELRDTVSYRTLHLMEQLTPPERAVFILREAFELPYRDIAAILEMSPAACRQLRHRAQLHLADTEDRLPADPAAHAELLEGFLAAARTGDLETLTQILAEDVIAYNDGGGRVRAALRPITGRDKVVAFITGLVNRYPVIDGPFLHVNADIAMWVSVDGGHRLVMIEERAGRIERIYAVLNPDKLGHVSMDGSGVAQPLG
jgi:RNA polymerase sigma-70 factor (ECF subfamily)